MLKAELGVALSLTVVLCSCSHRQRIATEELRSELFSAKSLSAETEMFLGYVRQHRATKHFAQGHLAYLAEELEQSAKKLHSSSPTPRDETSAKELSNLVDALNAELRSLRGRVDDEPAVAKAEDH